MCVCFLPGRTSVSPSGGHLTKTKQYHATTALLTPGIFHNLCSFLVKTPRNVHPHLQVNVWKLPNMAYWEAAKIKLIMGILVKENLVFVSMPWSLINNYSMRVRGQCSVSAKVLCSALSLQSVSTQPHPAASNTHLTPQVRKGETIANEIGNDLNCCCKPIFFSPPRLTEVWTAFLFYFPFSFRRNVKLRPWPLKVIKNPINLFTR